MSCGVIHSSRHFRADEDCRYGELFTDNRKRSFLYIGNDCECTHVPGLGTVISLNYDCSFKPIAAHDMMVTPDNCSAYDLHC